MQRLLIKFIAAIGVFFALAATPAYAQATRTWVSGVGDDLNPCSRTAPCKTFAGAISKTAAGGEISVLDPGGYGAVTITKSITIKADGDLGSGLASAGSAIVVNAGATGRVVIDGLELEGLGTATNGISITSAANVIVMNTTIRNFTGAGIVVNGSTAIGLTVIDSSILNSNVGINVISSGLNGSARVWNSYLVTNASSGIRVSGLGNKAEISGNVINRTAKSLDIVSSGTVLSDGTNVASAGDAPTGPLPKI